MNKSIPMANLIMNIKNLQERVIQNDCQFLKALTPTARPTAAPETRALANTVEYKTIK
jgi:hypothetical protein